MTTTLKDVVRLAQPRQLGLFGGPAQDGSSVLPKAQSVEVARALAETLAELPLAHREALARQQRDQIEVENRRTREQALTDAVHASALASDRLVLVDARAILDSAYHAAAARQGSDLSPLGVPVGGLRGFISAILRLLGSERPTHAAIVFDHPDGASRRRGIDPGYKYGRPEKPLDHLVQIECAKTFCLAMGLSVYCSPVAEADDVLATLVQRAPPAWWVVVSSPDKDLLALAARPRTLLTWWRDGKQYNAVGEKGAMDRMGVLPHQITDYIALAGDTSDGIPGIKGIGKKTACELLRLYGSLEGIYSNWGGIAGRGAERTKQLLREGRAAAHKSRELAQLQIDVDDPVIPSSFMILEMLRWAWDRVDREGLAEFGRQWGIEWLQRDMQANADGASP